MVEKTQGEEQEEEFKEQEEVQQLQDTMP